MSLFTSKIERIKNVGGIKFHKDFQYGTARGRGLGRLGCRWHNGRFTSVGNRN